MYRVIVFLCVFVVYVSNFTSPVGSFSGNPSASLISWTRNSTVTLLSLECVHLHHSCVLSLFGGFHDLSQTCDRFHRCFLLYFARHFRDVCHLCDRCHRCFLLNPWWNELSSIFHVWLRDCRCIGLCFKFMSIPWPMCGRLAWEEEVGVYLELSVLIEW